MNARKALLGASAVLLCLAALLPAVAAAAPQPAWTITATPLPANFTPGEEVELLVIATNVGGASTTGASAVQASLPTGVTPIKATGQDSDIGSPKPSCSIDVPSGTAECKTAAPIAPGRRLVATVILEATGSKRVADVLASAKGGGATQQPTITHPVAIQAEPIPFDFLPGFSAPADNEDGSAATLAGSHPYQQTVNFGFPTKRVGDKALTNDGHARNFYTELPRGLIGSPAATPVLCTEVKLVEGNCPNESQVGVTDVTSLLGEAGNNTIYTSNLYNMVPPPGYPAAIATNVANAGIFVHILASVRSDGDYGIEASVKDTIAFGLQPIFNLQAQIWGEPSAKVHDPIRGKCTDSESLCPVKDTDVALLGMPGDCPGRPLPFEVLADSWEEPSPPGPLRQTSYESADLVGQVKSLEGCEDLEFEPSISVRPTTNLTDSPSGLDVTLHQPQEEAQAEPLSGRATAILKDAAVAFPKGLAVNPSQAAGLEACSESQVGFEGEDEEGRLHFSKAPQSCPAAAKIGTLEAASPLLVKHNGEHEVEVDPETGKPIPEVLHGFLYIAKPFDNPFGSLIAAYLVVEDEKTGITAKLAGEGELDPNSGQLTTYFEENPEVPIEDIRVHIFGGARGAFITPPTCATFTTETDLVPWSAPPGEPAAPRGAFQTAASPLGGPCPASEAQLPNSPKLSAGTLNPQAGTYSPLIFKISREDGTQRLAKIETTLPTGLSARLAGVASCPDQGIDKARSREVPEQGAAELADPSCPAASEIGTVDAAAGAGPTPYHTQGHAYLAGPYKGAPLSIVAIAPAVAGPFDLGTVVVRSAVYLDPSTAQARVVSDPLPQILQGVPLDVRSVAVRATRPGFSLNPTSCDEKAFGGQALSTLGAVAPLSERFQAGGCKSLPYKPKLTARLSGPVHRGGHPRFRAVLTAKPGEANTAAFSLTLPHSEFIDQAHFRTICTRVQYAANQCPAGSVYGYVKAQSPLVDYTLEGPVYLRSSSHKLPDAVAALHGPPSQPIAIDAVARIDSVNGGLRSRVETVPDAPLTKVIVSLQGGKKGLFQNSTNICKGIFRIKASFEGQNGKAHDTQPQLKAQCNKGKGAKGKGKGKARH
jgi:hypothetical protein